MKRDRKKDKSEVEHYRGIIREQEKTIRQLTRQLKYFEKRDHLSNLPEPDTEPVEAIMVTEMRIPCQRPESSCIGVYDELPIFDKVYGNCNSCGHNKRLK